jgi:glucokinase
MGYRPRNPKEQDMTDIARDTTTSTTRRSFIGAGLGLGIAATLAGEEAGLAQRLRLARKRRNGRRRRQRISS